jgi:uncharacterized membrane protein
LDPLITLLSIHLLGNLHLSQIVGGIRLFRWRKFILSPKVKGGVLGIIIIIDIITDIIIIIIIIIIITTTTPLSIHDSSSCSPVSPLVYSKHIQHTIMHQYSVA